MTAYRTYNTLFLLQSLDGKISTGDMDNLDVDKDFKRIHGVKEGLPQYYDLEKTTDLFSLNSGKVMAKIGVNTRTNEPIKMGCSFIIIDNKPHLTTSGVEYLCKWVKTLFLVTTNSSHPALTLKEKHPNLEIINFQDKINFMDLFSKLRGDYQVDRVTIQSGGLLNAELLRSGLIDEVSVVMAPCLIGGESTPSLISGNSLHCELDLQKIKALKLKECKVLEQSYLHLTYAVINQTVIDMETNNLFTK